MKIITWNCNMAYRKKANFILEHQPDIVVVPECEHPDKLTFKEGVPIPKDIFWYGENKNKGLGIFSYSNYTFKLLDIHNPGLKLILPLAVTGGSFDFTLFAIWAYNPLDPEYNYIGQVWKALHYYENILKAEKVILAGDFNSNVFWDKLKRKSNHSMVVEKLLSLHIYSTYHTHLKQAQGQEEHPTYFMYRHKNRPYHIDYCFASANLMDKVEKVEIGSYDQWTPYSDHKPLMVTFKD